MYCGNFCQDTPNYTCDVQRYKPFKLYMLLRVYVLVVELHVSPVDVTLSLPLVSQKPVTKIQAFVGDHVTQCLGSDSLGILVPKKEQLIKRNDFIFQSTLTFVFFFVLFVSCRGYVRGCFPSSYFQYLSNTVQLSSITQATCKQCG